jgi:hypothetical protein
MAAVPTVLWRLFRPAADSAGTRSPQRSSTALPPQHARAVILPGGPPHTLTFLVNDAMDRAENYDTMDLALFRAADVKRTLVEEGWQEEE